MEQLGFFWKVESPLPKELGGRKTKNSSESRYEAAAEYFESSLPMSKRRKKAIAEPEEERSIPISKRRRSNINANSNTVCNINVHNKQAVTESHESEENEEAALDKCAFTLADLADMADKIPLPEPKSELESETSPQAESVLFLLNISHNTAKSTTNGWKTANIFYSKSNCSDANVEITSCKQS